MASCTFTESPTRVPASEFLNFAGFSHGDEWTDVKERLGEPFARDYGGGVTVRYDMDGGELRITVSGGTKKIKAIAIKSSPKDAPRLASRQRSKLNFVGTHRAEWITRLGQPDARNGERMTWRGKHDGKEVEVEAECPELKDHVCYSVTVRWKHRANLEDE